MDSSVTVSVADPDVYPGSFFYPSPIALDPGSKNTNKREGGGKNLVFLSFCSHRSITALKIILFLNW
jgi:hypothetical protein